MLTTASQIRVSISRIVSATNTVMAKPTSTQPNTLSPWCNGSHAGVPTMPLRPRRQVVPWIVRDGNQRSVEVHHLAFTDIYSCLLNLREPKDHQQLHQPPVRLVFHLQHLPILLIVPPTGLRLIWAVFLTIKMAGHGNFFYCFDYYFKFC